MKERQTTNGVILAGGLSRRMGGGDKGLAMLGGRGLLGRVVERVQPQVGRLVLNANGDPSRFADLGLAVIADASEERPGPLAGILAGLDEAAALGDPQGPSCAFLAMRPSCQPISWCGSTKHGARPVPAGRSPPPVEGSIPPSPSGRWMRARRSATRSPTVHAA